MERPESPGTPVARRSDGYVSSDACQACHPGEYASWRRSYHRRMTQRASAEAVVAPFDDVVLEIHGRTRRLSVEDGAYWVAIDGAERRRVVMTTGSHHFQAYWFETGKGRQLGLFPMMYKRAERRWLPFDALVLTPPDYPQHERGGEWNELCIVCHSSHGEPRVVGRAVAPSAEKPYHVISGYRSPKTNDYLRSHGEGVAAGSLHLVGKAVDVRVPGLALRELYRAAVKLGGGGVGIYPRSDFVHIDVGHVRTW